MTPHINAKKEEIAPVVLLPGDPVRAKWIADNFLTDVKVSNTVRNMHAYTGTYQGKRITVMGSGMGIGSIGIYSWELFNKDAYDVSTIIRVGSCGSYVDTLDIGSIVISKSSSIESDYGKNIGLKDAGRVMDASPELVTIAEEEAKKLNLKYTHECIHATDTFYDVRPLEEIIKVTGSNVVEMESYALFANAKLHGKKALTILTVSDVIPTGKRMTPEQRVSSLKDMTILCLSTAVAAYPK